MWNAINSFTRSSIKRTCIINQLYVGHNLNISIEASSMQRLHKNQTHANTVGVVA